MIGALYAVAFFLVIVGGAYLIRALDGEDEQ